MPNYVDNIVFENTFLDTQFDLGYDWDNYELQVNCSFDSDWSGYIFRWEGNGYYATQNIRFDGKFHFESFYSNRHSGYDELYNFYKVNESYTDNGDGTYHWIGQFADPYIYTDSGNTNEKYHDHYNHLRSWGRLYIGSLENTGTSTVGEIKLIVNGNLVMDLRPCMEQGVPCFYDTVRQRYYIPDGYSASNSMIKTVVMTGQWQTLPIDDGIKLDKIQNRIIEVNKYTDGYAAKYDEICLSADEDNADGILVSDYTENNQINLGGVADRVEIKPRGMLVLPWNKQIAALNRPLVKGHKGDLLRIVVR